MFKPQANYFTILRLEHDQIVPEFLGVPFLTSVEIEYPSAPNEQLVLAACYEVLNNIHRIDGVSTIRFANSIHYTCDESAVEMEPNIVERYDVIYDDEKIGVVVVCAEGSVFETIDTLQ